MAQEPLDRGRFSELVSLVTFDFRILGPLEVIVDDRPLALGGKRQRARARSAPARSRRVVPTDRLVERALGRATSEDGGDVAPQPGLAAPEGTRRGDARDASARVRASGPSRPDRRGPLRAACWTRTARRAGGAPGAAARRARPLAWPAARRVRVRRLRAGGDPVVSRSSDSLRSSRESMPTSTAGTATSWPSSSRSSRNIRSGRRSRRSADARALPLGAPGRGARCVPVCADATRRGARHRAGPRAQANAGRDPPTRGGSRTPDAVRVAEDEEGEIVKALLGRLRDPRARSRQRGGSRRASRAGVRRAERSARRPHAGLAVRRDDEGLGPALRRAPLAVRGRGRARPAAPFPRAASGTSP